MSETTSKDNAAYLSLSPGWKHKFALLEKAGGVKLPRFKELAFGERFRVSFNIWAFLFSTIYYLVKGMWRKAISYTLLTMVASTLIGLVLVALGMPEQSVDRALWIVGAAWFATRANIDYYKKVMLSENGWF
ncbi:hypothetical protein ASC94_17330 [Massilia sp. Root418]|nr:hypothetical protein ASC94_17330 [Massilia sp. Root418]